MIAEARLARTVVTAALAALSICLAGCGSSSAGGPPSTTGATESFSAPATEGTGPESPQARQSSPALQVASLPTGGGPSDGGGPSTGSGDPAQQCVGVAWAGPAPLPVGIRIEITGVSFDPEHVFEVGGAACRPGLPRCDEVRAWAAADTTCSEPVIQRAADHSGEVGLVIAATVHCDTDEHCARFEQTLERGDLRDLRAGVRAVPLTETPGTGGTGDATPSGVTGNEYSAPRQS